MTLHSAQIKEGSLQVKKFHAQYVNKTLTKNAEIICTALYYRGGSIGIVYRTGSWDICQNE